MFCELSILQIALYYKDNQKLADLNFSKFLGKGHDEIYLAINLKLNFS